jgi:AraC-like DNA-binding protein
MKEIDSLFDEQKNIESQRDEIKVRISVIENSESSGKEKSVAIAQDISQYRASLDEMISKSEKELCPVSHICHAGLRDTVVPFLQSGILVGFIVIGRVRPTLLPEQRGCYSDLNISKAEYDKLYSELPYLTGERFNGLIDLLSHILFEKAIEVDYDKFINAATGYIDENLHRTITIEELCRELYISKNLLYKKFHDFFDCTVNEYITQKRLDLAKLMLDNTTDSSKKIAENCGFDNYSYFSRLFKKKNGISPRDYRRRQ